MQVDILAHFGPVVAVLEPGSISENQSDPRLCLHDANEAIPVSMLPVHKYGSAPYEDPYNREFR